MESPQVAESSGSILKTKLKEGDIFSVPMMAGVDLFILGKLMIISQLKSSLGEKQL